jgi:uncharacterized protein YqjF (DUF2071 family)
MPACTALLPPSLQGHFLAAYTERATALEAEREGLKQHLREAHRQANLAQAKIKRLQEALADAQGHKEASSRRHGPPPPLPASICRLPGQLGRRRPCSV